LASEYLLSRADSSTGGASASSPTGVEIGPGATARAAPDAHIAARSPTIQNPK